MAENQPREFDAVLGTKHRSSSTFPSNPQQFTGLLWNLHPIADALLSSYTPSNNHRNHKQLSAGAWTHSGKPTFIRSLIKFDIQPPPKNYQLLAAKLSVFADTTAPLYGQGQFNTEPYGHSQLSGSNEWLSSLMFY